MQWTTQLTTRCPQCGGRFTVNAAQLQLRKGFVRCVHCTHIFDGYETIVPEDDDTSHMHVRASARPAVIRQRHRAVMQDVIRKEMTFTISDPTPVQKGQVPERHARDTDHSGTDQDAVLSAKHEAISDAIYVEPRTSPMPGAATLPDFFDDTQSPDWKFWVWSSLSLLALLLLVLQLTVIYRVQIASTWPNTRPLLEYLCGAWGCRVEYSRYINNITILNSSLRMQPRTNLTQEVTDSRLILHLTLRNQDDRPQQWPALLLDMTDFSGAVIIRKHLHPADYLPENLVDTFFAGKSELALRLPMLVRGVAINGYQITLFFP